MTRLRCGNHECLKLENEAAELCVTLDAGPRILHYALRGGENILGVCPDLHEDTVLGTWRPLGGHRLWAAPESKPRTYAPDNDPVDCEIINSNGARLTQPTDAAGLQKEMKITLAETGSAVTVIHRITNRNMWQVEVAPWALTILRGGGTAIIPQEPYKAHSEELLPARPLVLWGYTDLGDPRWRIGAKLLRLSTDAACQEPQKVGVLNKQGWCAYHAGSLLFVKNVPYDSRATYPDYGSNNETYTAGDFIELETLGGLQRLAPDEQVEHVEQWTLHAGVSLSGDDDRDLKVLLERVARC
jgi:hypothetical protein